MGGSSVCFGGTYELTSSIHTKVQPDALKPVAEIYHDLHSKKGGTIVLSSCSRVDEPRSLGGFLVESVQPLPLVETAT